MKQSTIFSILFWLITLTTIIGSIFLMSDVKAVDSDTAQTQTIIGNATPTISFVSYTETVTPVENSSSAIAWVTSTVTDSNGCYGVQYATSVAAVFYDDDPVNNNCTANGRNCYTTSISCATTTDTCTSATDTTVQWVCYTNVWHYANAGSNWKWYLTAYDGEATGTGTSGTATTSSLLALNVTETSINYGTLALNTLSSQSTTTVANTGNDTGLNIGIKESADFNCTTGNIAPSYQHYSQSTGFTYGDGTALSTTTATLSAAIAQGSDGTETPEEPVYWLLTTPADSISGSCTGTNYFEAQ